MHQCFLVGEAGLNGYGVGHTHVYTVWVVKLIAVLECPVAKISYRMVSYLVQCLPSYILNFVIRHPPIRMPIATTLEHILNACKPRVARAPMLPILLLRS